MASFAHACNFWTKNKPKNKDNCFCFQTFPDYYISITTDPLTSLLGTGHEGSLKMVGLPIVSNKRCSQSHKGILPITETKICAGGKRDQGVCEVRIRSWFLRSIVSDDGVCFMSVTFIDAPLTERLRWPIGVPGGREQGHSGCEHQRPRMCRRQASCRLRQRGLLLWMDPQSLQILFRLGNKLLDYYIFHRFGE